MGSYCVAGWSRARVSESVRTGTGTGCGERARFGSCKHSVGSAYGGMGVLDGVGKGWLRWLCGSRVFRGRTFRSRASRSAVIWTMEDRNSMELTHGTASSGILHLDCLCVDCFCVDCLCLCVSHLLSCIYLTNANTMWKPHTNTHIYLVGPRLSGSL